ncbi:30S ribosomal protein S4 [Candidatus Pacearchaeota archaeon]|nr:30S ribosomal protein S4 [Candidatus Pacearchaeota archaeon]|tara:strand:+ start:333 stop:932 length:600 start_codon:yes stop_codon:yes gene_type:complete
MIRKKKLFVRPKKAFESSRIQEENSLVLEYGLKNKREIWRTLAKVNYYRKRAMELARASIEEQEVLFNKLRSLGLKIETAADVLDLKPVDLLERRLPTIVFKKGLANTVRQARQAIVHKKILIKNRVVNSPSYLVPVAFEDLITLKQKKKVKKEKPVEEAPAEKTEAPAEKTEAPAEAVEEAPKEEKVEEKSDNEGETK